MIHKITSKLADDEAYVTVYVHVCCNKLRGKLEVLRQRTKGAVEFIL